MKIFHNKVFVFFEGLIRGVFTVIIIAYLLFILAQRITGNQSVLGYRLFSVATGSMAGVYEVNDVIAVKDWNVDELKVGDDIAYQGNKGDLNGMLITHRIIRIEVDENTGEKIFVTKGVNAPAEDPAILEEQILGKVVGVVPVISFLNHTVKSQLGFFLLIFCPLVLIIVLEVLQTITDIRLEKNEIQEIRNHKEEEDSFEKEKQEEMPVDEEKNNDIEIL